MKHLPRSYAQANASALLVWGNSVTTSLKHELLDTLPVGLVQVNVFFVHLTDTLPTSAHESPC